MRRIKAEIAKEFNYDLDALFDDIQRRERESGRTYVTLPPRRIEPAEKPPIAPVDTDAPVDIGPNVES